jgi:hypothetical protein
LQDGRWWNFCCYITFLGNRSDMLLSKMLISGMQGCLQSSCTGIGNVDALRISGRLSFLAKETHRIEKKIKIALPTMTNALLSSELSGG